MYRFTASILLALSSLLIFSGCRDQIDAEDIKIPRLMIETRGVNYGSMLGQNLTLPVSGTKIQVQKDPLVDEFEIINVELVKVDLGLALMIQLTEKGTRDFYRGAVTNMGGRVVLTINGNPIGARRISSIDQSMQNGDIYTFVEVDDDELGQLVLDIRESLFEVHSSR